MCKHEVTTNIHIREVKVCKRCSGGGGISWYRFDQYIERWIAKQNGLFVAFSDREYANLKRLAKRRNTDVQTVLRSFANNVVGGDNWRHPSEGK